MLDITDLLRRKYEIENELRELLKLEKELEYINGLLNVYKNHHKSDSGYETRAVEEVEEYCGNLQGVKPTSSVSHKGKVYRYDEKGNFIGVYADSMEAKNVLVQEELVRKEIVDETKSKVLHNAIEYACTGTYNPTGKKNKHTYRDNVWFAEKLTDEEMEICRKKKIFK